MSYIPEKRPCDTGLRGLRITGALSARIHLQIQTESRGEVLFIPDTRGFLLHRFNTLSQRLWLMLYCSNSCGSGRTLTELSDHSG